MIPDQALDALKERNPVFAVAGADVRLRKGGKFGMRGPCPLCSKKLQSKTDGRFECDADKWVCGNCQDGGDVIKLVMKRDGVSFREAIDRLGGADDGPPPPPTPAMARRAGLRAYSERAPMGEVPAPYNATDALRVAWCAGWSEGRKSDLYAAKMRERERRRLYDFWCAGEMWRGTPVEHYLVEVRGVSLPDNARLRFHPDMPMFADGREHEPLVVHRGPAMLAAFQDRERVFRGLHITWLDPRGPKGKANVHHPDTGEVLPSKKMRGTKAGCYLDLGGQGEPRRLFAGEGIETVGAVHEALRRGGRDLYGTAFRAAGDLGNLAGKAELLLTHPTLKTDKGRARRVPGPDPDLNSPAMPVPDSVVELVLLGDGDSDPFLTRNALERASRRNARDERIIRARFAPAGLDYDDMMQGKSNDR